MTQALETLLLCEQLYEALKELRDLMNAVYEGEYTPDSFTVQPADRALTAWNTRKPCDAGLREAFSTKLDAVWVLLNNGHRDKAADLLAETAIASIHDQDGPSLDELPEYKDPPTEDLRRVVRMSLEQEARDKMSKGPSA